MPKNKATNGNTTTSPNSYTRGGWGDDECEKYHADHTLENMNIRSMADTETRAKTGSIALITFNTLPNFSISALNLGES